GPVPRNGLRRRAWLLTVRKRALQLGTNSFRVPPRVAASAVPSCAIVCPGSSTPKQWDLTSSISRQFIQSVPLTAKDKTILLSLNLTIPACRTPLVTDILVCRTAVGTRTLIPPSARWRILPGWKRKFENAGWKLHSISQSTAPLITLTWLNIRNGFMSDLTAPSSLPKI